MCPGDGIVGSAAFNQTYNNQNVTAVLTYPQTGTGALINYFDILLQLSPNALTKLYVTSGSINQRFMTLVIEAYNTNILNYLVRIFGIQ